MKELRFEFPMPLMCRMLNVTASGYYNWLNRPASQRQRRNERLAVEIRAVHKQTRETYGSERLHRELTKKGVQVSLHLVRKIRREQGIRCKQKRKFKATTNSRHALPVAENLLKQDFVATAPNQVWVTDITYVGTDEGWLYLASHKDLFTREIVGYAMSKG